MGRDEGEGDEMRRDRGLPGGASRVRPARPGWTARWFSIPAGPRNFTMQKGPGRGRGGVLSAGGLACFRNRREGRCRRRKAAQE